jgi:L-asparagine transporter-like permease
MSVEKIIKRYKYELIPISLTVILMCFLIYFKVMFLNDLTEYLTIGIIIWVTFIIAMSQGAQAEREHRSK